MDCRDTWIVLCLRVIYMTNCGSNSGGGGASAQHIAGSRQTPENTEIPNRWSLMLTNL